MKATAHVAGLSGLLFSVSSAAALALNVAACSSSSGSDTGSDSGSASQDMNSSVGAEAGPTGPDGGGGDATATDSGSLDSGTSGGDSGAVTIDSGAEGGVVRDRREVRDDAWTDPMVPMAPFYFPLVYNTANTTTGNAFGGKPPIIGLFDWRPKDIDEAVVVAESDDNGKTWYFMQTVLELNPDYTNPISGGYSATSTQHRLPGHDHRHQRQLRLGQRRHRRRRLGPRGHHPAAGRGQREDGGQFLYMLDRNTANMPGDDDARRRQRAAARHPAYGVADKFPIWNTNNTIPAPTTSSRSAPRWRTPPTPGERRHRAEHGRAAQPRRHHGRVPDRADRGRRLAGDRALRAEDRRTATTRARPRCRRRSSARRRPSAARPTTTSPTCASPPRPTASTSRISASSRPQRSDDGRLQRDPLGQPARHAARHQRRRQRVGPVLLGRQLPRRRLRRLPLHRLRRVDRQGALDRLQRHQPPHRVDQHDHHARTRPAARW